MKLLTDKNEIFNLTGIQIDILEVSNLLNRVYIRKDNYLIVVEAEVSVNNQRCIDDMDYGMDIEAYDYMSVEISEINDTDENLQTLGIYIDPKVNLLNKLSDKIKEMNENSIYDIYDLLGIEYLRV